MAAHEVTSTSITPAGEMDRGTFAMRCACVAARGEQERGSGGVVYYDDETRSIGYLLIDEVRPVELRERVRDIVCDDAYVILHKTSSDVHITMMKRAVAFQLLAGGGDADGRQT